MILFNVRMQARRLRGPDAKVNFPDGPPPGMGVDQYPECC
jgi:hypothetical protein